MVAHNLGNYLFWKRFPYVEFFLNGYLREVPSERETWGGKRYFMASGARKKRGKGSREVRRGGEGEERKRGDTEERRPSF
jgi:hypothetical protein